MNVYLSCVCVWHYVYEARREIFDSVNVKIYGFLFKYIIDYDYICM